MENKLTDERYTPKKYLKTVRTLFGGTIDLDPFSCVKANERVKAVEFYSKENSAFDHSWKGKVYSNPPYSRGHLPKAVAKLIDEYKNRNIIEAVWLVPNWTDRRWFQDLIMEKYPVCLTDHRIEFFNPITLKLLTNPEGGSCFFYLGNNPLGFKVLFSIYGVITND